MNSHEVEYLLIGGYAVAFWGYPRNTGDIDIWIKSDEYNAMRIIEVYKNFGFNLPALKIDLFTEKNKVIRIGNPPFRIEILTTISGVDFDECFKNRIESKIDGININIICLDDLLKNKKAAGRLRDMDDYNHLVQKAE